MIVINWLLGLVELLSNSFGFVDGDDNADGEDDNKDGKDNAGDDNADGDADGDSGKDAGKDRSKYIPRERFDKVNTKAQKVDKLIELGIIAEDEDGELRLNPEAIKKLNQPKDEGKSETNFRFTKDEVDEKSWPLVDKINKGWDFVDKMFGFIAFKQQVTDAYVSIVREYPEFLQKGSELRKKADDIFDSDKDFKKEYRGRPDAHYQAVKLAAKLLEGKQPDKTKPKPKSSFIVGKGDVGKTGAKMVDITKLSKDELDKLEKQEHERLEGQRVGKK